jgi:hypothetical protein
MYSSGVRAGSFQHGVYDAFTAGGKFKWKLNRLLSSDKELKRRVKTARDAPGPGTPGDIAAGYLRCMDDALESATHWVAEHPKNAWQLRVIKPDANGLWLARDLAPGSYEIVIRGKASGFDASWEATIDLSEGRTYTLPAFKPRFVNYAKSPPTPPSP